MPATVPIVEVTPHDKVGALFVTATVFLVAVILPLASCDIVAIKVFEVPDALGSPTAA